MKKIIFLPAFILWCALVATAQHKTGTLTGHIEDEKGKPLAAVEVRAMSSRTRNVKETTTDKEGNYALALEPDDYTISFDAEGFGGGTMTQMQQVEEGKETKVKNIKLYKARKTSLVRGAVFDERGFSLPGVQVKLLRVATEEEAREKKKLESVKLNFVSNSRGEFAFRVPSLRARYQVTAMLRGYKPQVKTVDVNPDEAVPLAFTLEAVKE
ncbi:MAG: carboxypeptidase regulatory-like domain-containing protein [Acidobacteria bacterium]|nr:carboxypeptidase regulatory-like domain-containing protein [Acidobacteriota bacterium]